MEEISLEKKQRIILDILTDIDEFCREQDIPYSISSGTLLGAVRHGGFIPWDDDADMFMLRDDFERFTKLYKNRKYHLLYNTVNDDEFFKEGYAKVSDPNTFMIDKNAKKKCGVNVDIFPLDYVPSNEKERKRYMKRVKRLHNRLHHRHYKDFFSILKSYYHSLDWWWKKCYQEIWDSKYKDSDLVAHILGTRDLKTVINKNLFDTLVDIEFEGRKLKSFKDTDSYLTMVYGDYMTPPPIDKRQGHHKSEKYFYK